ncbi:Uncharacterized protein FWK35_00014958 [Aphis craccivora]|uniref:Uncharacterized protein n=1 Tax=Aphis craccivora TaxID=307492 RepID=A0A6G0YL73_APHCR|nr:Uncharacterized protein FWK35_00014958 [Aphis craccivora]
MFKEVLVKYLKLILLLDLILVCNCSMHASLNSDRICSSMGNNRGRPSNFFILKRSRLFDMAPDISTKLVRCSVENSKSMIMNLWTEHYELKDKINRIFITITFFQTYRILIFTNLSCVKALFYRIYFLLQFPTIIITNPYTISKALIVSGNFEGPQGSVEHKAAQHFTIDSCLYTEILVIFDHCLTTQLFTFINKILI